MSITITGGITISGGGWTVSSAANDPYFMYNTMLLPGNGTNLAQNNTFLDGSTNNFTVTRNGNTTQGTFSPYGSNWGNYFADNGNYFTPPSNAAFALGTGDFTIEAWFYRTGTNPQNATYSQSIFDFRSTEPQVAIQLGWDGGNAGYANKIFVYVNGAYPAVSTTSTVINTWYHVAYVRSGATAYLYINGVMEASYAISSDFTTTTCRIGARFAVIGADWRNWQGYISNARIVKGTAVYTANFTPSTVPLTIITNTSLLTCQSNRFIDNSSNAFALTISGIPIIQRFSPFSPGATYSSSTIGGSGYFDGTGDYLSTSSSSQFAPTGDFTIAFWYYPITLNTFNTTIGNYNSVASTDWLIEFTSDGSANVYTNGSTIRIIGGAGTIKSNQWSFVTLSRLGTTITFKVNGTSVGTYTQSGTFGSSTKTIQIGRYYSGTEYITGYLSDVRLIDGSEVTTIPTSPLTAVSGTNLLLNFTNAGIIDNAMQNNLETVGNAQISTTQSKFGGSSMYFDGVGDYLSIPAGSQWSVFGTGEFTIEAWVYTTAYNTSGNGGEVIVDNWAGSPSGSYVTNQWQLLIDLNGLLKFIYATNTTTNVQIGTGTVSLNTWTHVATVRSGTTLTLYINGTASGSATVSQSLGVSAVGSVGQQTAGTAHYYYTGYIDDLRITKGYARYTSNFTAPTSAFPTL